MWGLSENHKSECLNLSWHGSLKVQTLSFTQPQINVSCKKVIIIFCFDGDSSRQQFSKSEKFPEACSTTFNLGLPAVGHLSKSETNHFHNQPELTLTKQKQYILVSMSSVLYIQWVKERGSKDDEEGSEKDCEDESKVQRCSAPLLLAFHTSSLFVPLRDETDVVCDFWKVSSHPRGEDVTLVRQVYPGENNWKNGSAVFVL